MLYKKKKLPSLARAQCLGWGCHGIYTAYCAYGNSKYIEKPEKTEKLANKFIFRQNRQLSIINVLSQVSILVATESKPVSLQQEWPLTMEKIN